MYVIKYYFLLSFFDIAIMIPVYSEETGPIAYAGSLNDSQKVTDAGNITLDASKSYDPDGDNLNYYCYQIAGPNVTFSAIRTSNPTFTAPNVTIPTTLTFGLAIFLGFIPLNQVTETGRKHPNGAFS